MSSSEVKLYATPMKNLMPKGYCLEKDAVALMSSIIYEINNSFIDTISNTNKDTREIRAKNVEESLKPVIPTQLWRCIAASGSNAVLRFHSGCITYEVPKSYKIGYLEPRTLKKGIEELAKVAHSELLVTRNFCSLISNEMQRLAVYIADNCIASMTDDPELAIQNLKRSLINILGQEVASHADIHAENYLQKYRTNRLDLNLKWLRPTKSTPAPTQVIEGCKMFSRGVQKLARTHVKGSLAKDASFKVEESLKRVLDKILENAETESSLEESEAVTERSISESVEKLLPDLLFRHSAAHAQTNNMRYRSGILKYKHEMPDVKRTREEREMSDAKRTREEREMSDAKRTREEEEMPDVKRFTEDEEMQIETKPERVKADYGKFVKRIMKEHRSSVSKEFLAQMNKVLNDLSYALAGKCFESAGNRDGPIIEKDVVSSVNELLSDDIRNHAFARIRYVQENFIHLKGLLRTDHHNPTTNRMYPFNIENMEIE